MPTRNAFIDFLARGGINLNARIYLANCKDVRTYIFSYKFNPHMSYSYMNRNFKLLIQECVGSLYWRDEDSPKTTLDTSHIDKEEKSLSLYFDNEFNEKTAWESNMKYLKEENDKNIAIKNIKAFIQRVEHHIINEEGIELPQIVVTFDDKFLLPIRYKIIRVDFSMLQDIQSLPFYDFPYQMANF